MKNGLLVLWLTVTLIVLLILSSVVISMWDQRGSDDEIKIIEQGNNTSSSQKNIEEIIDHVNSTSSSQENTEEEIEITKYTFQNYGGKIYTPEPMEFGADLINGTTPKNASIYNETERKHVLLQFYDNPTEDQLLLLEEDRVEIVGVAEDYTYIVSMPASLTPVDLPAESGLRWMGEMPVRNKYDNSFGLNVPEWSRKADGEVELWLSFYEDVTYEEALTIANKYSTSTPEFEAYPYAVDCIIITNESNITVIAGEDIIKRVSFSGSEPVNE